MATTRRPGAAAKSRRAKPIEILKSGDVKLTESDVLAQVLDWLNLHGWFTLRTFPGKWVGWGEHVWSAQAGKPFAVRPRTLHPTDIPDVVALKPDTVLWVELKRPGERPTFGQDDYHRRLRATGYKCIWCDCYERGGKEPFLRSIKELGLD